MNIDLLELEEEFRDLETPEDRIQYLIELGQSLPALPLEFCTEEFRVVGCQSMVWFVPKWDGSQFTFQATSDAPMVRGLAAVLVAAYSGKTPAEVLSFPVDTFFQSLELKSFLSPLRSNGLHSMIQRIKEYAAAKSEVSGTVASRPRMDSQSEPDFGNLAARIDEIRRDFPILLQSHSSGEPFAYLDNAASSQRPTSVLEAMQSVYLEHFANVHRSGHEWASKTTQKLEDSRDAVSQFLHAESKEQIIFTSGATDSINLVAQSWGRSKLRSGDEILLSEMEHHSNIVPWQQLAEERGCTIRWIPIRSDYTLDLDAYQAMLSERCKLVAITAVSNVLGTINPIASIVKSAHRVGAVALVDAAQATPHGSLSVTDWDADFVVFSGHKMLASTGVGVLYGKRELLDAMPPWKGGGNMIKSVDWNGFSVAGLPHKFEAGTPPIAEIVSLKPAIEYLRKIGNPRLMEHERSLAARAIDGLNAIPFVETYSPSIEQKSGIVAFQVRGVHGEQIARVLDAHGIAIRVGHHCAMPLHQRLGASVTCRASFYLYNTMEEVDRFVRTVASAVHLFTKS